MPSQPSPRYVILVALTFDATGDHALREASSAAALHPGSQLHIVHVVEGTSAGPAEQRLNEETSAEMKPRLERVLASLPLTVLAHLRSGPAWRAIAQTAADIEADLLVLGSHQRHGVAKLVLGSVAQQVVQHAHCPVLIAVPKDYSDAVRAESIAPPCPRCIAVRQRTGDATYWCDTHSHQYAPPHVYEPRDRSGASATSTTYSTY